MSQIDIQGFEILSSEPTMDRLDRLREERRLKELRPGTFVSAVMQENLLAELSRRWERNRISYDPNWTGSIGNLPQETQDLLLKDLPAGQHTEVLDKSRSYQEAWVIANQLRKINERNLVLQDAGFSGILARIGAAISDPAAIGLGLATGSIGYFGTKSAQAARISYRMKRSLQAVDKIDEFTKSTARLRRVQMVRSGLVGGVTEAGIEAVLSGTDPTRGATDILFAALGGGIMTGAASNIGTRMGARAGQKRIQLADFERWGELGGEMTEKGKRHFAQVSERANARMMDDMIGDHGLPKEETGLFDSVYNKDKKVWALRINGRPVPTDGTGVGMLPFEYSTGKRELLKLSREEVLGLAGRATPNTEAFLGESRLVFVPGKWLAQRPDLEGILEDIPQLSEGLGRAYLDGDVDKYLDDFLRSRFGDTKEKIPKGFKEEIVTRLEELAEQHNIPPLADRQAQPNIKAFASDIQVPMLSADLLRETPELLGKFEKAREPFVRGLGRAYVDGNLESYVNKFVEDVFGDAKDWVISGAEGNLVEKFKGELIRNVEDAAETHNVAKKVADAEVISPKIEDNRIVLDITDLTDDQVVDLFRDTVKKMPDNASGTDFKPDLVSPSYAKSIKGIFGKRFTISGILGNSKDKFVRMYNNITAQDALAKADGTPQSDTASEWTSRNHGSYMGAYNRVANDHFSKWSKAQGTSWSSKFEAKQKFLEEVTRGVRGEAVDEHVMNVVKFQRKMIREIFDIGKRHGVRGLEDVFAGKNYVPRIWSVTKIMKMEDAIGRKGVVNLLRGSLADTHDDFSDELLDKWAEAVFVLIRKGDDYNEIQRSNIISGTDPDLLEDALGKIKGEVGLTDEQIAKIVGQVQEHVTETKKVTKPLTARAMRRIDLNELHEGKGELAGYKISDLFENNSGTLMDIYTKQILGSAAMSRTYQAMELQMKVPIKNLKQLKEALGRSMGREGVDSRQIDRDMAKIETIEKSVMGRRMSPDTASNAFARNLRLAQHIRLMGQLGFANLPELGAALASHGYRVLFQQMPVMKKIWQQSLKGEMSEPLLKEVVAFWNMGLARKNDQVLSRLDVGDAVWNAPGGTGETWMKRGARLVNDISLFAPINIFQQQSAVLVAVQKWANYASEYKRAIAKGVQPKLPGKKRLASMGLTQEDARKILSEMSLRMSEGENVPGFGRRVKQINIDSWRDTAAANKFILAVDRWSNSAVQSPNIGNLSNWMTTDFGRVISQFRTFTFVSLEKQLQAKGALFFEDWQTAMEWSHGLLVAGLVYMAQEQILSAGRPDRAEYLKERMSLSRIGRVAFSRSTFTSFSPDAFDSISSLLGQDAFLFNGRNSQLPNTYLSPQGLLSNPTSDFANKIIKGLQDLIIEPAMGDGFPTQAELRQASTLLPAYRAFGIHNALNLMTRISPEQE